MLDGKPILEEINKVLFCIIAGYDIIKKNVHGICC